MRAKAFILGAVLMSAAAVPAAPLPEVGAMDVDPTRPRLPCPFGWTVVPNPSIDNSLSYLNADGTLAVSVTSVSRSVDSTVEIQSYARVSAQQMQCRMPVRSNLIANGYSFMCENDDIEAVVYGSDEQMVLLAISGRTEANEPELEEFVRFLADQAGN